MPSLPPNRVRANHATLLKTTRQQSATLTPLGVLRITPGEQSEFCEFEANLHAKVKPEGIFENEAVQQFIYAAWRLRKTEALIDIRLSPPIYEVEPNRDRPLAA
ncbi:MAG: hypothetical protein HYX27_02590 [Acidobacteria bacterium]|nr:hypothetical protein [Acidobacteriota bacterium]